MFHLFQRKKKAVSPAERGSEVPAQMHFAGSAVSDVGRLRANNEDNYVLGQQMNQDAAAHSEITVSLPQKLGQWQFAGVFDGMGGGEKGELAACNTASVFLDAFQRGSHAQTKADVDILLRDAFLESNNRIVALQKKYRVFGTTGTVLCTNGTECKLYHLGDSRAYLNRAHELLQLTKDQTVAQMKREVGIYHEDDPSAQTDKHRLVEYIGRDWTKENLKPAESQWLPVLPGDILLLCSDGLYDMCTDAEIAQTLQSNEKLSEKAAQLVRMANSHGGEDNITCILMAFTQ